MPPTADLGLVPLILPDPASHQLDVIFLHGLNGHRERSWTNKSSQLWPLWLMNDLPGTRVWTYGYEASINVGSRDSIRLHAIRLLSLLVNEGAGKCVCTYPLCPISRQDTNE